MRITADTNFLISATQWDYSVAHKLLLKLIERNSKIFTTKEIIEEFSEVLIRDFYYSSEEVSKIVNLTIGFLHIVEPVEKIYILVEDPDDNAILECAVASNSEYIITYDKYLLRLREFKGIKIIKPEELFDLF